MRNREKNYQQKKKNKKKENWQTANELRKYFEWKESKMKKKIKFCHTQRKRKCDKKQENVIMK